MIAALVAVPASARAQEDCPDGGVDPGDPGALLDFFPGSADRNVPLDGFVRLRYDVRVPRPVVASLRVAASGVVVPARVVVLDSEVHLLPDAPLSATTVYEVRASDVAAGAGGTSYRFTTGSSRTTGAAPGFAGLSSVSFARSGSSDRCGDPNAVQVTANWPRASSNGWPDVDIEYLVFQTAGPGLSGPVLRARTRGATGSLSCTGSADEQCITFRLTSINASDRVCFAAVAVDPSGLSSNATMAMERCADPQVGNYFYGCSVPGPASSVSGATLPATSHGRGAAAVLASVTALAVVSSWGRRARRLARRRPSR